MTTNHNRISRLGFGLYIGEESDNFDMKLLEVMRHALENGINFFDCAPSYRNLRSEKVLGKLLNEYPDQDFHVSTKGGFIPFDFSKGLNAENEFVNTLFTSGLVKTDLFDQEYFQSFDTNYLKYQFEHTLNNLNRTYIDIYYIHNPEYLLYRVGIKDFLSIMRCVIQWISSMISEGKIKSFGVASWDGFIKPKNGLLLQLEDFIEISNTEGIRSYFQYIQIPYNLSKALGAFSKSQILSGENMSLFRAAQSSNIDVISSAPLNQGKLTQYTFPDEIKSRFNHLSSASLSLKFVLSTPGIKSTLISTSSIHHLNELLSLYNSHNENDDLLFTFLNINKYETK